ncbi:predicted protein [Candida tropicalis MYA-3404]|uniref:Uncharacterized protein n=1 Tax=Candida tropicalis (strain ATCC MYA-3404 / T1) TaxID=294747 RepID=C5M6G3_CANTT|nr:predicted protein [Candida tropicalis MYA-3404]EER34583.1 predicted protein [Candida tropicalis MYA-3404]KAG4408456.1 hypothetical protein JTP64_001762 [Candida tropicalis]
MMIKYFEILVERFQNFFQKYSVKQPEQIFHQRPIFSRNDLVSCLQDNEDINEYDRFARNIVTLSSTFDVTGSNYYNSTSEEEEIQPQLLSIEQICSLIDDELEIINENKIDTRLDSRESFPTISKDDNLNTQLSRPWTDKLNYDNNTTGLPKSRKIKIIKKKKSSVY